MRLHTKKIHYKKDEVIDTITFTPFVVQFIVLLAIVYLFITAILLIRQQNPTFAVSTLPIAKEQLQVVPQKPAPLNEIQLDVPLIKQMDHPKLFNGCEVTSLAMLLEFWGINVTKNEVAEKLPRVPIQFNDGTMGNPNIGFVGNMEVGPGLGVYHTPIFQLAQTYMNNHLKVEDLTNQPFSTILEKVGMGLPVWVITTTNFSPISSLQNWSTSNGQVKVTYNMHSVVITGYDHENIYINDPYGTKNKKTNKEKFFKSWEQMGSQAIVIEKL